MLCDTFAFKLLSHHETSDVLKEEQWDVTLGAHLNEMSSFLGCLREKDSLVSDYANRVTKEMTIASEKSGTVPLFEFMESTAVKDSTKDSSHVDVALVVNTNDAVQLVRRVERLLCKDSVVGVLLVVGFV